MPLLREFSWQGQIFRIMGVRGCSGIRSARVLRNNIKLKRKTGQIAFYSAMLSSNFICLNYPIGFLILDLICTWHLSLNRAAYDIERYFGDRYFFRTTFSGVLFEDVDGVSQPE
jgi:hypothetical protein